MKTILLETNPAKLREIALRAILILICSVFIAASQSPWYAMALTDEQKKLLNQGVYYYDPVSCDDPGQANVARLTAGTGAPDGLTFPSLNPDAMAKAINEYIRNYNQSAGFRSVFTGLGNTFVSGAKNSNINPFFIVAIAQKESQLGKPTDYNVRKGNNAFGRTATESQPNFQGSRLWYYWSSAKASLDHSANENQRPSGDISTYIKDVYGDFVDANDLNGLMNKYAPPFENDTQLYISQVKERMGEMIKLAGGQASDGSSTETEIEEQQLPEAGCACPAPSGGGAVSTGGNNVEIAFDFFVNENGFTPELAAAFIGNFRQESGEKMEPSAVNPSSGATGIVQWLGGRKTGLIQYAATKGTEVTDLKTQLEYVIKELNGSESAAYSAIKAVPTSGRDYIATVTHVIRIKYERPGEAEANDPQRIKYANEVYNDLKDRAGPSSASAGATTGGCPGSSTNGVFVSADGYAFPVEPQRKSQNSGVPGMTSFPCSAGNNCHGGRGSGVAFDIGRKPGSDQSAGAKVYAFTAGTIQSFGLYKGISGCYDFQLKGDDGFYYWYGHLGASTVKDGDKVTAGQAISTIGPRKCTGNGSDPHLHIDRGCTIGGRAQTGGRESCRDGERMKKLMNKLFGELPE